jgi:hypothetical protein
MGPKKGPDGKLAFVLPMGNKKLPGIAVEDIGKCAFGIFKRPDLIGKTVGVAGEHLTGSEMAAALSLRWNSPLPTTRFRPTSTAASASPGPTTLETCSSSRRKPRVPTAGLATLRSAAHSILSCRRSPSGCPATSRGFRSGRRAWRVHASARFIPSCLAAFPPRRYVTASMIAARLRSLPRMVAGAEERTCCSRAPSTKPYEKVRRSGTWSSRSGAAAYFRTT